MAARVRAVAYEIATSTLGSSTRRASSMARKPIWMGIPSVRLLPTPQLCEQIVGRLDIAEVHQKLPQGVIVQRIRLILPKAG